MNDEIENGEIILINSIGEKVCTQKITLGENNIITHGLSSGLYCYVISQNNQQVNKGKFIIR